ncbi:MAG: D-alanyl-D-alanine carboxypeptidase [Alphaproteobacteria bacterium]|nr:D-alanyl-D-alanine carboxypeptidase [Alphaproteobacteria bacterium]
MRKLLALCSMLYALAPLAAHASEYRAAIVADMDTGAILFRDRDEELNYPASLTKIMTLYLTFDALESGRLHLSDQLIVSAAAANAPPVKLGLAAGSKISVDDAIKAVAVHSANDVARVLAENLRGGREATFASMMTDVANQIGLSQTNFENASGLPDDDHLSSARDIALLAIAIHQHFPGYWKYFGIRNWTYGGRTYTNGNKLLGNYAGANGMKTGFTNSARYCLVATAARDGKNIVTVVLGAPNRDVRLNASRKLLDRAFGTESRELKIEDPDEQTAVQKPKPVSSGGGKSGVQFGAFGSRNAATEQAKKVQKYTGIVPKIEQTGGMFRVRAYGLSATAADGACKKFRDQKLDCFIIK